MTTSQRGILRKEEVPAAFQDCFDYTDQTMHEYLSEGRNRRAISRTCANCGTTEYVKVSTVRDGLKSGTFTGMCQKCWTTQPKTQSSGPQNKNWRGGKRITPKGYVMIRKPEHPKAQNGYIQEHRYVIEQHLGRYLLPKESVHHKNGSKQDNRLENLELWGSNHSSGQRYEDMTTFDLEAIIVEIRHIIESRA